MNTADIISGATYWLQLTANENPAGTTIGKSFTTESGIDMFLTAPVIEDLQEAPPAAPEATAHTCGQCIHLQGLEKGGYNSEAYKKRPWGDCHIYARSPEFQSMVENHPRACGWTYAPGRYRDQPACQHFKPKKP